MLAKHTNSPFIQRAIRTLIVNVRIFTSITAIKQKSLMNNKNKHNYNDSGNSNDNNNNNNVNREQ